MFDFSPVQIIIAALVALLVFGPRRLPGMGRDLGRGLREFKDGITGSAVAEPVAGGMDGDVRAAAMSSAPAPIPAPASAPVPPAAPGVATVSTPVD